MKKQLPLLMILVIGFCCFTATTVFGQENFEAEKVRGPVNVPYPGVQQSVKATTSAINVQTGISPTNLVQD